MNTWQPLLTVWETWWPQLVTGSVIVLVMLLLVLFVRRFRRRTRDSAPRESLAVDVSLWEDAPPPDKGVRLELYGTPVHVILIVIAPVGRQGHVPSGDQLPRVVEQWIPGMQVVLETHQPSFRFWPHQLSSQGFVHAFFNNVPLPGDRGRGTPWSSLAGRFRAAGGNYLAGVVVRALTDNGMGQLEIQHEGQWNDVLRVKAGE
jgi:hypothetical protein